MGMIKDKLCTLLEARDERTGMKTDNSKEIS